MHELALCESVVRIVEREARAHDARRVRSVRLRVGALSCASAEAVTFCFRAASHGTLAADARLEVIRTPGAAWCLDCATTVGIGARGDACPLCGGYHLHVTSGEELQLTELEIE
jgi:hydrogenase nickel incorporation protein HypA/HybF